jgi:hypothetical protein
MATNADMVCIAVSVEADFETDERTQFNAKAGSDNDRLWNASPESR